MYMSLFLFLTLLFYYIVNLLLLLLFIAVLLSFGCCDEDISLFAEQIKEF